MSAENTAGHDRLVLAHDGSPAAESALPIAHALASQFGSELDLLYVSTTSAPAPDGLAQCAERERAQLQVSSGDAAAEIVRAASDAATALLILTTHGRDREAAGRLGHVAEQVVTQTSSPVLLVRPETAPAAPVQPVRLLLLPLDGATVTARSLRPVFDLAKRLGAAVDVLAVVGADAPAREHGGTHAPRFVDQPQHEWRGWSDEIVRRLWAHIGEAAPATSVTVHVQRGEIGEAIVRYAADHACDAIVLVRRSKLQPGRAGVLRLILARAPTPLLVVCAANDGDQQAE
jgi:nucleotide-binding universal stress UspA family protein